MKIAPFVCNKPSVYCKRCWSLRNKLTQSHFSDMPRYICASLTHGTYRCGFCAQCSYVTTSKEFTLTTGKVFVPWHFVSCSTPGVIYLITSFCGNLYVGKTSKTLSRRIYKHIRDITTGILDKPLGCHEAFKHGYRDVNITVRALDHAHPNVRGDDIDKCLLKL